MGVELSRTREGAGAVDTEEGPDGVVGVQMVEEGCHVRGHILTVDAFKGPDTCRVFLALVPSSVRKERYEERNR